MPLFSLFRHETNRDDTPEVTPKKILRKKWMLITTTTTSCCTCFFRWSRTLSQMEKYCSVPSDEKVAPPQTTKLHQQPRRFRHRNSWFTTFGRFFQPIYPISKNQKNKWEGNSQANVRLSRQRTRRKALKNTKKPSKMRKKAKKTVQFFRNL